MSPRLAASTLSQSQGKESFLLIVADSVAQLCLTLWDPMDCSSPGFPVLHYLPELAQTHIHWVGDAIQQSHPRSPPSLPVLGLSQPQGIFQWLTLHIRWPKYWSFSFSINPPNESSELISLRIDGLISLLSKRLSRVFSSWITKNFLSQNKIFVYISVI